MTLIFIIIGLLCVIVVICPCLYYFKQKRITFSVLHNQPQQSHPLNDENCPFYEIPITYNFHHYSQPIILADFENYVKQCLETSDLDKQYTLFKNRDDISTTHGNLRNNQCKNKNCNFVPFDYNRVVLREISDSPFSDYINASHVTIADYSYILAESPMKNTVNDFWRMIWEKNVENVVMLDNQKYWPETEESFDFNGIIVKLVSFKARQCFKRRIFEVAFSGVQRRVNHLCYTDWTETDFPADSYSLVKFIRNILIISDNKSPILIHCSDGVNKSGAVTLITLCLQILKKSGKLNVFYNQKLLRDQRLHVLNSVQLYKFVHLILLECLATPNTEIQLNVNFQKFVDNINLTNQMDYINNFTFYEQCLLTDFKEEIIIDESKNRFQEIVPESKGVIYLSQIRNEPKSKYINAVKFVDFETNLQVIATQQPMSHTVNDFWRLVCEYEVELIVSIQELDLEDSTCCSYWPTFISKKTKFNNIYLSHLETEKLPGYEIVCINLKFKRINRHIKVIHFKDWFYGNDLPSNKEIFLTMHNDISNFNSNKIVVTCKDGATGCGLYTAMSLILKQMKLKNICDVCRSVRMIRRIRKQFIKNEIQLAFLYDIAKLYNRQPEILYEKIN